MLPGMKRLDWWAGPGGQVRFENRGCLVGPLRGRERADLQSASEK